ncbi:hypothetical protein QBC40DRAFT_327877 [Triangularia verruculosa]|uniref:Uncharacterized protein n=1 Tax=Triangularia verruculosa TaxID=2587418 RepID=A0AAN7AUI8_9PEZI|nr:hypothetical protein QBC40DRAFT_327877 [Triangularia verruculosa]
MPRPPANVHSISVHGSLGMNGSRCREQRRLTLESIKRSKTLGLSIDADCSQWWQDDGFGQLARQWRDALIKSFGISPQSFRVTCTRQNIEKGTEILYTAKGVSSQNEPVEDMGYIRFRPIEIVHDECYGLVEIVNRGITLQPGHLSLVGQDYTETTDGNTEPRTFTYEAGLQFAVPILTEQRTHSARVRCISGNLCWSWKMTGTRSEESYPDTLVARLHRMKAGNIRKENNKRKDEYNEGLIPFPTRCDQDLKIEIGGALTLPKRYPLSRSKKFVALSTFENWTMSALFLQPDAGTEPCLSTVHGNLLWYVRDSVYLDGVRRRYPEPNSEDETRSCGSVTGRRLRMGYSLARTSSPTAEEEAKALWDIWNNVLVTAPRVVCRLSEMLNNFTANGPSPDVADASFHMTRETAERLKTYLCSEEARQDFRAKIEGPEQFSTRKLWYYAREEEATNPRLKGIIEGLNCTPSELARSYWELLSKYDLLRTAAEEEHRRFSHAPVLVPGRVDASPFGTSVAWGLRACVRACPWTTEAKLSRVEAAELNLDIVCLEVPCTIKVHSRWLASDFATEALRWLGDNLILWDIIHHTIIALFTAILSQFDDDASTAKSASKHPRLALWTRNREIRLADQRLAEYGLAQLDWWQHAAADERLVDLAVGVDPNLVSRLPDDGFVEIQLHCHETCGHLIDSVLLSKDLKRLTTCGPRCRSQRLTEQKLFIPDLVPGPESCFLILRVASSPNSFIFFSDDFSLRLPTPEPEAEVLYAKGPEMHQIDRRLTAGRWYEAESKDDKRSKAALVIMDDDNSSGDRNDERETDAQDGQEDSNESRGRKR